VAAAALAACDRVVRYRLVALRTCRPLVAVVLREAGNGTRVTVGRGGPPGVRAVAPRAIRRKSRVWNWRRRRGERRAVARVAIRRQGRVIVVRVAGGASHGRVRSCQRKRRRIVIKTRRLPCRRRVARGTIRRESRVRRRIGGREILLVAIDALGRRPRKLIVLVAGGTRHCRVGARQGKVCLAVIECRRLPCRHRVARRTVGGEPRVRRRICVGEILLVAIDALGRSAGKLTRGVA
jgi:hypothetical protein